MRGAPALYEAQVIPIAAQERLEISERVVPVDVNARNGKGIARWENTPVRARKGPPIARVGSQLPQTRCVPAPGVREVTARTGRHPFEARLGLAELSRDDIVGLAREIQMVGTMRSHDPSGLE